MPLLDIFKQQKKSLSEVEDETEQLEMEDRKASVELSIAQKRQAAMELRKRGLAPKHFGFDFGKIVKWLKEH